MTDIQQPIIKEDQQRLAAGSTPTLKYSGEQVQTQVGGVDVARLRSLVERIEHLQDEVRDIQLDIRDIFAEAKSAGFDTKVMRQVLKLRKMNAADRDEQEFMLAAYRRALDI